MASENIDQSLESLPRLVSLIWPLDGARQDDAVLARRLNERLVDRLDSPWGRGQTSYRSAPFLANAHAAAGWQDPRGPRDIAAALLTMLDNRSRAAGGRRFRDLDDEAAQGVLASVMTDSAAQIATHASAAFRLLRQLIYDALFSESWDQKALGWDWLDRGGRQPGRV